MLQKYKEYLKSEVRVSLISEILFYDAPDAPVPTSSQFVRLSNIVMGEIIMATGIRPVVLLELPNGPFEDATTGEKICEQ